MNDRLIGPSAGELEAAGKAMWQGKQPIEDHARYRKGRPWVPLEAAIADVQFWQRRDYESGRAITTLTARVETLEGALGDRIAEQRETVARMCLSALFGFEFKGESLCDDAERIFSRPSPRSIRAVAFADQLIEHFTRAALSPDPAVKPSAEGGAA